MQESNPIRARARAYAMSTLVNPTKADFLYAENLAMIGFMMHQTSTPATCPGHEVAPEPTYDKRKDCKTAYCKHCRANMGSWYCPDSPNHLCEYTRNGIIDYDACLYCGEPDERK